MKLRQSVSKSYRRVKESRSCDLYVRWFNSSYRCFRNFKKVKEFETNENRILVVVSKSDKGTCDEVEELLSKEPFKSFNQITSSTKNEDGLDELKKKLANLLQIMPVEGMFIARRRHLTELENSYKHIKMLLKSSKQVI